MKSNRHSLVAKGIMVLLSLLVLVFAFTYSWLAPPNRPVNASGLNMVAESSGDFEYAIGFSNSETGYDYLVTDFTNSSTRLNFEALKIHESDTETYNLLHDYKPIDVTGDGATLIRPAMSYGNSQIDTDSVNYSIANPNVQYLTFDLFFRSKVQGVSLKLGNGSYAVGACEIKTNTVSDVGNGALTNSSSAGTLGFNKSNYGNFSKDAIVGAVRVAFVPYLFGNDKVTSSNIQNDTSEYIDSDSANTTLWLPRPDVHVNSNDTTSNWTLSTATYPAAYQADDGKHTYYNIFKNYQSSDAAHYHKIETFSNTITPTSLAAQSYEFTRINSTVQIGDYYYTKVNVRVWVEGTDLESRRALSGGRFAVNFKFTTH